MKLSQRLDLTVDDNAVAIAKGFKLLFKAAAR